MKTKMKISRWILVVLLAVLAAGSMAQTNNSLTQTVCIGNEPYRVEETLPGTIYNWRVDGNTTGAGWVINGNGNDSINIDWNTPGTYELSIFTTLNGCNGDTSIVTVTVQPALSVTIAVNEPGPICAGTQVTFTATAVPGGPNTTYEWYMDDTPIPGATSSTYTYTGVAPGGTFKCKVTDPDACAGTVHEAWSNEISIQVNEQIQISVTIAVSNDSICLNEQTVFTATAVTGGATITYQWFQDGSPIAGATAATYTYTGAVGGGTFTCVITSLDQCVNNSPQTSNPITIYVKPKPVTSPIFHN